MFTHLQDGKVFFSAPSRRVAIAIVVGTALHLLQQIIKKGVSGSVRLVYFSNKYGRNWVKLVAHNFTRLHNKSNLKAMKTEKLRQQLGLPWNEKLRILS
jgi:hypothetical protein